MANQRLTLQDVKNLILERHNDLVEIKEETFKGLCKKAFFIDKEFGEWETLVRSVVTGCRHPKRAQKEIFDAIRYGVAEIKERIFQIHGIQVVLDEKTYVNTGTVARFVDAEFGEWLTLPKRVLGGCGHPKRGHLKTANARRLSLDDVKQRLFDIHGTRVHLKEETYGLHTRQKATFVDEKFGEWKATPASVLEGRGHPKGSSEKACKTMKLFTPQNHWRTNEICFSQSGYEFAVLTWLNENRIDFDWQIPFEMDELLPVKKISRIYTIDLFMKDGPFAQTFVEIKGTWSRKKDNDSGLRKWLWFQQKFPNSRLWMKNELLDLGIIDKKRTYLSVARGI